MRLSGELENRLASGRYVVKCWIHREHNIANLVLHSPHVLDFVVFGKDTAGVVSTPAHEVTVAVEGP